MQIYLLFDSGCAACTHIAHEVESLAGGLLEVRSLSDASMQTLLTEARPDWRWKPSLLLVGEKRVRLLSGPLMTLYLLARLGIRRTWRIADAVIHHSPPQQTAPHFLQDTWIGSGPVTRRAFLAHGSLFALGLLLGLPRSRVREQDAASTSVLNQTAQGENYAGFVLLPEKAPVPDFVKQGRPIIPKGQGEGVDPALVGETVMVEDMADLLSRIDHPVYLPEYLPAGWSFIYALMFQYVLSGELWEASINYGTSNLNDGLITIRIQPEFSRPCPVWPVHDPTTHSDEEPVRVPPEKVTITPNPGIMLPSASGYSFRWIKHDVLYSLNVENYPTREQANEIAQSLRPF